MKIINRTDYDSGPLQKIIRRVAAEELDQEQRNRMRVEILFATRGVSKDGYIGFCYGRSRATLILPKNEAKLDPEKIAHVTAHEFAHARGMSHKQMRGNPRYDWVGDSRWDDILDDNGKKIHTGSTWSDGTPVANDYKRRLVSQTGWRNVVKQKGYCEGIETVSRKRPDPTPRPGAEDKLAHAQAKVVEWERKARRADTGLKSWSRKVKYFQRQVAAKKEDPNA